MKNNFYNYPVDDSNLDRYYELLAVRKLLLRHRNSEPLYFDVTGYEIATKEKLKELGYPVNSNKLDDAKYILYSLKILDEKIPVFSSNDAYVIIGNGVHV